ncbi:class D sortase [Candidatus Saccharibacteria bacterium]|nr:class D sortase [Candidatus Saccharibacteria bacterium]
MNSYQDQSKKAEAPSNPALRLIRQKIAAVYDSEPGAREELAEVETLHRRSKHQLFMHELSTSGKSLAEIQTAWHNYYVGLPDVQKHQVWQEFYAAHGQNPYANQPARNEEASTAVAPATQAQLLSKAERNAQPRSAEAIKAEIFSRLEHKRKLTPRQHLRSLLFGLGMGSLVILILLFSFFNERFIAPLITPSRSVSSTPIIIDPNSTSVGPEPKLIIPKINVELPVIFDEQSADEKAIQRSLEDGVIHYPSTSYPGEVGNGAIFGHSSNNILNKGKYKFAFVLLRRLEPGDTFMIQYKSKRYVYKIYDKKVVKPTDVNVLGDTSKSATISLITCDPPGTSLNRLVVWGEQISPDVSSNVASSANKNVPTPSILPSNAPSLWERIRDWFSS